MYLQERNLFLDMQGEDVRLLHSELQSLNYDISQDEIARSFFGPATHDAVLDFQCKRGLEPNGVVDERTYSLSNDTRDLSSLSTDKRRKNEITRTKPID